MFPTELRMILKEKHEIQWRRSFQNGFFALCRENDREKFVYVFELEIQVSLVESDRVDIPIRQI